MGTSVPQKTGTDPRNVVLSYAAMICFVLVVCGIEGFYCPIIGAIFATLFAIKLLYDGDIRFRSAILVIHVMSIVAWCGLWVGNRTTGLTLIVLILLLVPHALIRWLLTSYGSAISKALSDFWDDHFGNVEDEGDYW